MSSMTAHLQKKLLDDLFTNPAYTPPAAMYLSLHTASPTKTGSLASEVSTSGTGYIRKAISSANMGAADATTGISVNTVTITFGPVTSGWGTLTHVGISDAVTAGNMLLFVALSSPTTRAIGASFQLSPGQLRLRFN